MARRGSQTPSNTPSPLLTVQPTLQIEAAHARLDSILCIHLEEACKNLNDLGICFSKPVNVSEILKCRHCQDTVAM